MQPTILIWGAGRIGRGFVADLFAAAGYRLAFVETSQPLVDALSAAGGYTVVRSPGGGIREDRRITGYVAAAAFDVGQIAALVGAADLMAVAVFPDAFAAVAQAMVPGLERRQHQRPRDPLDILICANLSHAAQHFRAALDAALSPEARAWAAGRVGVVDTMVMRMVVDPPSVERAADPLLVWTNGTADFPIDGAAVRGPLPAVPGLRVVDSMPAEETRKLYTYNMYHAALAYLGALRGHERTVDCLADASVGGPAAGALEEVSRALQAEYGFGADVMRRWIDGVIAQTDNPTLGDTVARHGADPRRKLRRGDRLTGPALLARRRGIAIPNLALALAAAFRYDAPGDAGAMYVRAQVRALGLRPATMAVCELTPGEAELADLVAGADAALRPAD
jgi:mannitol-1-phosphate 5-dehydrogenase